MEIYMHREIGKRGSLDMIRDIVMINEEGEAKEEKDVKKRKIKPDDSGKKKRPPQRTPLKYFLTGSGGLSWHFLSEYSYAENCRIS